MCAVFSVARFSGHRNTDKKNHIIASNLLLNNLRKEFCFYTALFKKILHYMCINMLCVVTIREIIYMYNENRCRSYAQQNE